MRIAAAETFVLSLRGIDHPEVPAAAMLIALEGCGGQVFAPGDQPVVAVEAPEGGDEVSAADAGRGGSHDAGGEEQGEAGGEDAPADGVDCCSNPTMACKGGCSDAAVSDDACAPSQHNDGIGQTWTDCALPATYDAAEGMAACKAGSVSSSSACQLGTGAEVCSCALRSLPNDCACWAYGGPAAGHVSTGPQTAGPPEAVSLTDPAWN